MPKKIHVVKLTAEEQVQLKAPVTKGKAAPWKRLRAQAMLLCDQGGARAGSD